MAAARCIEAHRHAGDEPMKINAASEVGMNNTKPMNASDQGWWSGLFITILGTF